MTIIDVIYLQIFDLLQCRRKLHRVRNIHHERQVNRAIEGRQARLGGQIYPIDTVLVVVNLGSLRAAVRIEGHVAVLQLVKPVLHAMECRTLLVDILHGVVGVLLEMSRQDATVVGNGQRISGYRAGHAAVGELHQIAWHALAIQIEVIEQPAVGVGGITTSLRRRRDAVLVLLVRIRACDI